MQHTAGLDSAGQAGMEPTDILLDIYKTYELQKDWQDTQVTLPHQPQNLMDK
jgi:hypothetical protein